MNSPLPPDPYNALGVPKDATSSAIRLAHRRLVLTCHPDKVTDEKAKAVKTEQFQQVQQAYEILSDDSKRKRYDEKVKVAELRAELMSAKRYESHGFAPRTQEYPPRPTATSSYEMRGNAIYEERVPRRHSPDDDYQYENVRSTTRKTADRAEYASSRRRSGPAPEEIRRSKGRDFDAYEEANILRERENERKVREHAAHADRRKRRDKDRRQASETKHFARVEVVSESDSEYETRRETRYTPEPERKYETTRHKARASRYSDSESDVDLERKHIHAAMSHIQEKETRPKLSRYVTKDSRSVPAATVPPPPPPPPPALSQRYRDELVDTPRRSSARSRSSRDEGRPKLSREERRPSVIDTSEARRPGLPTHTSEPANIQIPHTGNRYGLPRSATMETRKPTRVPGAVRSTTTPLTSTFIHRYHSDSDRARSTKARAEVYESPSSGSRSPSPDPQSKPSRTYRVSPDSGDDRGKPRIIPLDPERSSRSAREVSPQAKRPSFSTRASTSARTTTSRSNSYAPDHITVPARPFTGRSETSHEPHRTPLVSSGRSKTLFGEVQYSQRFTKENISWSDGPKTASAAYYDRDPDRHECEPRSRPAVSRREPYRRGETVH